MAPLIEDDVGLPPLNAVDGAAPSRHQEAGAAQRMVVLVGSKAQVSHAYHALQAIFHTGLSALARSCTSLVAVSRSVLESSGLQDDDRAQVVERHVEARVAVDEDDHLVGVGDLRADGGGEAEGQWIRRISLLMSAV